ncbi:hypothetical protein M3Y94_00538800 [Aphelenchoides besseyi]|nr:hypothetical protein M3Y94_00538800 [Aphelenchoides besseyi]KAI6225787.1 hypothetical protein M3Y95_00734000 [Aphelenchoides besseyi]
MTKTKTIQQSAAVFFLIYTVFLYLYTPDWWIYGWLSGLSGILLLLNKPTCPYWRFFTSLTIVFGTLQTLFLFWSVRHVEKAAIIDQRNVLPEGRNILISAIATIFSISSRLRHSSHGGLLDVARSLVLVVALVGMLPIVGYSSCFYVPQNPICHVFH